MNSYRIVVRTADQDLDQGTAWLLTRDIVCTAFHVVGNCSAAKWAHELDPARSYWLDCEGGPISLNAAAFDARADVAVLWRQSTAEGPLPLADFSRSGVAWKAVGFPGFHDERAFTLSGEVVAVAGHDTGRAVQLTLDQGADVAWEGVSGSAVVQNGKVVAVITNVTHAASTAWAAPVTVVRRLLRLLELRDEIRALVAKHAQAEIASISERLAGADHTRTSVAIDAFHRTHPEAVEAEPLKEKLAASVEHEPYLGMPSADLAGLQSRYELVAERDGATRFRINMSGDLRELFLANRRFGGRKQEFARLDKFVAIEPSGYVFVTGLSGYGKTSLLAKWIETLQCSGELSCFHFFNGRVPESLDPKTALSKLCKQLLALHRVGGELPFEIGDLKSLYAELIGLPAPEQRPLVVVLDGLDEVLNTLRPGPALFPERLGDGVHVVFSARATGKNWLNDLGLSLTKERVITLGQLGRDDIAEVLARAELPATDIVLDKLAEQTKGDPFYVADIVRSLLVAGGDVAVLDDLPADHSDYLKAWWNDAIGRVTRPGFIDLMGTLAALHAPLARNELMVISRDDELKPATIDLLLEEAARYLERDEQHRYWLTHDRIRQFVQGRLGNDMDIYRQRLVEFARHWNDPKFSVEARDYGRSHAVAHLLERDSFAEALGFLDAELIAGKWREEGSYQSFLVDIDLMLAWISAHPQQRDAVCAASALAIAGASARDLMRGLPSDWYRARLRLGRYETLRSLLDTMPKFRGEAHGPLLAVADEMLRMVGSKAAIPRAATVVADLVGRTIGMLQFVRTSWWKLEALAAVCRILVSDVLDGADVEQRFRQALALIESVDEPVLKAACLAHLAGVVIPGTRAAAELALHEAERMAEAFEPADRLHVHASALAGQRRLQPGRAYALLADDLRQASGPRAGSLCAYPLNDLLRTIEVIGAERDALFELANRLIPGGTAQPGLALALYRSGARELAWQAVDIGPGQDVNANFVVRAIRTMLPVLDADDRAEAERRLVAQYRRGFVSPMLAESLGILGLWSDCLACLDLLEPSDVGSAAVACIGPALALPDKPQREQLLDQLIARCRHEKLDEEVNLVSQATLALARANHARSTELLSRATTLGLSELPEGDSDSLRLVTAVVLASSGELEKAEHVAFGGQWAHRRIASLLAAARAVPSEVDFQRRVAQVIAEILVGPADLIDDVLKEACAAAKQFAVALPNEARMILERAEGRLAEADSFDSARCRLTLLDARVVLDESARDQVATEALLILVARENISLELFMQAGRLAVETAETVKRKAALERLRAIAADAASAQDRLRLQSAFAAILARSDPAAAYTILSQQIDALEEAAIEINDDANQAAGAARMFVRMVNELTGGQAQHAPGVVAAELIATAIAHAAAWLEATAVLQLLGGAWMWIGATETLSAHLRGAAAKKFLESLAELPPAIDAAAADLADHAARDVARLLGSVAADEILAETVFDLAQAGRKATAEALLGHVTDPELKLRAEYHISLFDTYYSIPDRTPIETALFAEAEEKGLAAVVIHTTRIGKTDDMIVNLLDYLHENHPRSQIIDRTLYFIPHIVSHWGADAALAIVDGMEDLDGRLVAAAARVGTSKKPAHLPAGS